VTTPAGFGTAPFGTSSFAAPRNIRVSWGRARVRALVAKIRAS
jgi:hypothetical protein